MSTFWLKAFELILSLGLLVLIHEFGHYMFARIFGIKVEKFYLFFNPWVTLAAWHPKSKKVSVLRTDKGSAYQSQGVEVEEKPGEKATWRDTEYGIGWVPLGGYCAIAGMIDETQGADKLAAEPQPWEFRSKPAWQRLFVMIGGVLNNFLLAIIIYAGMVWYWGEQYLPFSSATEGITYSESAHKAGFQDNDIPLMADGQEVRYFNSDQLKIAMAKEVKVLRGQKDTVSIKMPEQFVLKVNDDMEK
ncbi:MAG: site-2 protease family protein, partial [Bacteroidales bacterium]|nr:site-2 protease family protein [Bacteroidales bacterium]